MKCLTQQFNAVPLKGHFPAQWKVTPPNELAFIPANKLCGIQLRDTASTSNTETPERFQSNATRGFEPTRYRGVPESTPPHPTVCLLIQFAEYTSTDRK
jgi:hypothetical protein